MTEFTAHLSVYIGIVRTRLFLRTTFNFRGKIIFCGFRRCSCGSSLEYLAFKRTAPGRVAWLFLLGLVSKNGFIECLLGRTYKYTVFLGLVAATRGWFCSANIFHHLLLLSILKCRWAYAERNLGREAVNADIFVNILIIAIVLTVCQEVGWV